ncbi:hypothetical protein HanPI659440_Chr15g0593691 [Helianthus annuus]|nr:hypothetical protein HanPI659440_Chr15g0593691 [Helianthus annuus]
MAFICFTGLYSDVQVHIPSALYPTSFYLGFTITLSSSIHPPLSTYRCRQPPPCFAFLLARLIIVVWRPSRLLRRRWIGF